ncbi:MAG: DUF3857 domain-containing protein [Bacteroidota bacterium]
MSKPTYDIINDSLSKYDVVNIFYKNQISIDLNTKFEITYTIHQKSKIFSKKGLDIHPEFLLPNVKLIEKIRARSIKPDGSYTDLKAADIKITTLEYGSGICKFVIPATEIGDEVEFLISYTEKGNPSIADVFFHREAFTILSEFTLSLAEGIKIESKGYNQLPAARSDIGKGQRNYIWTFNNLEKTGKGSKLILYNDLPFLRIAIRSVFYKNKVTIPVEYAYWSDFRQEMSFYRYTGHRLSYDKNLGSFITKHMGAETDHLTQKQRLEKLAATIGFINDSLTLFYPRDTAEANKLLGEHLKNNKLPYGSIMDLYSTVLDMTYFDYYLCLGRGRELGDIDANFVSRNQIKDVFFSFVFDGKYYFIFPKEKYEAYDFGEIPEKLEGTKAIIFPRNGTALNTNLLNLPLTTKIGNTKNINTFAYINLKESNDKFLERTKLFTTGALTSIYRNLYNNQKKDSVDISDVTKILFDSSEDQIDSLSLEKSEHVPPFIFSLKFNRKQISQITSLNDSLKVLSLSKIISHRLVNSYLEEDEDNKLAVSFAYTDNIKYYLMFDKDIRIFHDESENVLFENDFGVYELKIKQLNPTTVYVLSKLVLYKSNLNLSDHTPLHELCRKVKNLQNTNLSFKVLK